MNTHPPHSGPSPYLIGVAIGLLNIWAFAAFRKGIGVSAAYENSAALAARRLAPDAARWRISRSSSCATLHRPPSERSMAGSRASRISSSPPAQPRGHVAGHQGVRGQIPGHAGPVAGALPDAL
jgi:hypothetical protein